MKRGERVQERRGTAVTRMGHAVVLGSASGRCCAPAPLAGCSTGLAPPLMLPPCRGQIRFLKKGPQRCQVKLTISYEVPSAMAPFASVSRGQRAQGRPAETGKQCMKPAYIRSLRTRRLR